MSRNYDAAAIEVLTGLEPVRKRPGMYTDTTRPNHLAQEVIDNSVDEVLAGYARTIEVSVFKDGSIEVSDDGRGMPVDIHPEERVSGVEVILTRLHAGGKFSHKNYRFSGGLHGVGVSVVNALSKRLDVRIRRGGQEYAMRFAHGEKQSELEVVGKVGKQNTGTTLRFWPDPDYFDSPKYSLSRLRHLLRAKAVLAPGLRATLYDENSGERDEWYFEGGLQDYLRDVLQGYTLIPQEPFDGSMEGHTEAVDWAVAWLPEGGEPVTESYVNLVPTTQGGTHVNGLRSGLTEAVREFCEFRNLLPRGVKIAPDDVWERCCYILSVKLDDAQFAGQTKERLSSRECAAFVSGVVKDSFGLWLNQHIEAGEAIALMAINNAQSRMRARSCARRLPVDRRCRASSPTARPRTRRSRNCFSSRVTRPAVRRNRPAIGNSRPSCRCGARS